MQKLFFLVFTLNLKQICSHIREVLEDHDSSKRHKYLLNCIASQDVFGLYSYACSNF